MSGPKITAVPGQAPGADAPAKFEKDASKKPASAQAEEVIEADTEEEALELANKRNRAVFCPTGWVCPSVVRDSRR